MNFSKAKHWMMALTIPALVFTTTSCDDEDDDTNTGGGAAKMETYNYAFNNGEVGAGTAYGGDHNDNFTADLMIKEDGANAEVTVTLNNTVDGVTYMVHSHDAADPATTPNGTPYNETPNADVLVMMIQGNGGTVSMSKSTTGFSYEALTTTYAGFFVVHDPLQAVNTADISTYLVVGSFGRDQGTPATYQEQTFSYDFNTGQVAAAFAYGGSHPTNFMADITVKELANNNSRVSVVLKNTINGETYPIHAHDKADPATTPNGTPYNESPNGNVLVQMAMGNGGDVRVSQTSTQSFNDLTTSYEAFFVVHDPLQAVTTTDPTTYVILGNFAR
jgi:hypothetical protein